VNEQSILNFLPLFLVFCLRKERTIMDDKKDKKRQGWKKKQNSYSAQHSSLRTTDMLDKGRISEIPCACGRTS
jgi:hypothetical protein